MEDIKHIVVCLEFLMDIKRKQVYQAQQELAELDAKLCYYYKLLVDDKKQIS